MCRGRASIITSSSAMCRGGASIITSSSAMCRGGASLINSGIIQFSTGGLFPVSKASMVCLCTSGFITPGLPN